jgi:transposase
MKHLSTSQRNIIIFLHGEGKSVRDIAKKVKCSRNAVHTTIKRQRETGSTEERKKSGRRRVSTQRDDKVLLRLSLKDRHKTSPELLAEWKSSTGVQASSVTVRRRLLAAGLKGCKARKKPLLTLSQQKRRLAWAKEHLRWTANDWRGVVFSDESTFTIHNHCGNSFVRRRPGEEFKPYCLNLTVKHPTSVMVWGCMASSGVGRLSICDGIMNATKYIETLEKKLKPSARDLFGSNPWIFQDDNAPCHTARKVKEWYKLNNIHRIEWPAQSPDLNPIENLWHRMGLIISKDKPTTKIGLIESIIKAWNHIITCTELEKLVESMHRRCRDLIEARVVVPNMKLLKYYLELVVV